MVEAINLISGWLSNVDVKLGSSQPLSFGSFISPFYSSTVTVNGQLDSKCFFVITETKVLLVDKTQEVIRSQEAVELCNWSTFWNLY